VSDDLQWRRPPEGTEPPGRPEGGSQGAPVPPPPPVYAGPPRTTPPPPDWRPRVLIQTPPPRELPRQDHAAMDAEEKEARTVTLGVGMVAGAVLLVVLFVLCGRALF
jgi:hypothetical protein